jgi:hypothetical protein
MSEIDGVVLGQVNELLFGEFLNHEGNRNVDEVEQAISNYSELSRIAGHTAGFVNVMTHVGNNARLGVKYDSSEPFFAKAIRFVQPDRLSYSEVSKLELAASLPLVLQAIVDMPELDRPQDILAKLQGEGIIRNDAYKYSLSLMNKLKTLAAMIVSE